MLELSFGQDDSEGACSVHVDCTVIQQAVRVGIDLIWGVCSALL